MRSLVAVTLLIAVGAVTIALSHPAAQYKVVPGSAIRGEKVLDDNGCLNCHAVSGQGGNRAPDFSQLPARSQTPALLATTLWNHAPRMWAAYASTQQQIPNLTTFEAADLFAYFYSTQYFATKGDPDRGASLFQSKNCAGCHSEVLDTRPGDSLLQSWTELKDPVAWSERMWNHSSQMVAATANRGIPWPTLSEQDMVDLVVFLGRLSREDSQTGAFGFGEPEQGRLVFERACESCHSFGDGGRSKVNLAARRGPSSVMGYAAAMWNHAPGMRARGAANSATLNSGEMRDLMAYLFSQRYFFEQGEPARGASVYEAKNCVTCHETGRAASGAPDLTKSTDEYSPITLTSALWRHKPSMFDAMRRQGIPWPEFQQSEMTDLIAYLNSRLAVRVAR